MGRRAGLLATIIWAVLAAGGAAPAGAVTHAGAAPKFRPRIDGRLGLIPVFGRDGLSEHVDVASGVPTPVVYHGGPVMAGTVTVHTIFWAPSGYAFQGSPGSGTPTYEQLVQQYFTDAAHDSGASGTCTATECDALTVLTQYAEGVSPGQITPGDYQLAYSAATDSVDATDSYPAKADQCASPAGTATCITDAQVEAEIDHVIQSTPGAARGLNNLWYVFLPPGVDECISADACGTNVFAAYHAAVDMAGHGLTAYAVSIDPIIEGVIGQGADPEGFPDAEAAIDGASHETAESISDPVGTGWLDPNGFEIADKCVNGPEQVGTPLGFAPNGSPYDQVINGHRYLLQEIWANVDSSGNPGCVQATTTTTNQLPLPQVNFVQFSPVVSGNVNVSPGGGIGVRISLVRADPNGNPVVVAQGTTTTASDGSWSLSLGNHGVGDDRDEIDVDYSGASAPKPAHQVILTGNGGNPVTEAGWTGWTFLDAGSAASTSGGSSTLTLAPCGQTGVLSYSFNGAAGTQSPTDECDLETDAATLSTPTIGPGEDLTVTSNDNRAYAATNAPTPNLLGGLVSLTVPVGEPNSVSQFESPLAPAFTPTGLPACSGDLELQVVECFGLVPNENYELIDGRKRTSTTADDTGTVAALLAVRRGDSVVLSNGARTLTTLHLAHLRVDILGEQTSLAGGSCQPGDYYGAPPSSITPNTSAGSPTSDATGGIALTGEICPLSGDATGLDATDITQSDDLSPGLTETEVPDVQDTSPIDGETVRGAFRALAESGFTLQDNSTLPTDDFTRIAVRIVTAGRGITVFKAGNVDTAKGVAVPALKPGNYIAIWTLTDTNGDRRLVSTRFISQTGPTGPAPAAAVACRYSGGQRISCSVRFPHNPQLTGSLRIRLTRGGTVVGLGHGHVSRGHAKVGLRVVSSAGSGPWQATLVLSRPHLVPVTILVSLANVP